MNKILLKGLILGFVLVIFLSQVFSGKIILPQSFQLGVLTIHYYGIIMALAVASAFYLAIKRAAKFSITKFQAEDLLFWLIVGGFLGARLYHIFSSFAYYYSNPTQIFMVWQGGLSIYGAVLGGLAAFLIYKKIFRIQASLAAVLDWLAPSVLLGQVIGRFGNLFNYEAFGYPTGLPWKMFVPENFRPIEYLGQSFFHPFFLYESLGNLIILAFLLKVVEPKNVRLGQLGLYYLLLYNMLRFSLEFIRIDSVFVAGIRQNAVMSLLIAGAALTLILLNGKSRKTS